MWRRVSTIGGVGGAGNMRSEAYFCRGSTSFLIVTSADIGTKIRTAFARSG